MDETILWVAKALLVLLGGGVGMAVLGYPATRLGQIMDRRGIGWNYSKDASAEMMGGMGGLVGFGLGLALAGWLLFR